MKSVVCIIAIFVLTVGADPMADFALGVEKLLPDMKNRLIYAHPVDSRFGVDLDPMWSLFFRTVQHRDFSVRRTADPSSMCEISASYRFDPLTRRFTLELYLYENDLLKKSVLEIPVTGFAERFIPDYRQIFDRGEEEERILFRGYLEDRLSQKMKNAQLPMILKIHREFQLNNPRSLHGNWKNQLFLDLLRHRFGIRLVTESMAKIDFDPSGSVVFSDGREVQFLTDILPPQPRGKAVWAGGYLASNSNGTFERTTVQNSVEQGILDRIETFFCSRYPKLFSPFKGELLLDQFYSTDKPVILNGTVSSTQSVSYQWITPRSWVNSLELSVQKGRTFLVSCEVREIIQDSQNPYRFWVIADQLWRTLNEDGSERYADKGFLVVNFDCTSWGEIESVAIHYRLWIYRYPFVIERESKNNLEQIKSDLSRIFSSINGVESTVKMQVKESILNACRTF